MAMTSFTLVGNSAGSRGVVIPCMAMFNVEDNLRPEGSSGSSAY